MFVFIDESGNHNLNYAHIDDPYNIFVLGAICISEKEHNLFDIKLKKLKKDLFGDESFILHTVEITRPNKSRQKPNKNFNDPHFRKAFYRQISQLIEETNFETCQVPDIIHIGIR
jgi:hypothetical protein